MDIRNANIAVNEQRQRAPCLGQADRQLRRQSSLALPADGARNCQDTHVLQRLDEGQVCSQAIDAFLEQLQLRA